MLTVDGLRSVAGDAATRAGISSSRFWILDDTTDRPGAVTLLGSEPALEAETVSDPRRHVAVLPYSSGTTGRPKGVMLTHRNLVANIAQISGLLGVGSDSTVLGVLPFSHIYGMTVVLNLALRQRAALVAVPRFELEPFLKLVEDHGATHLFVAPPIVLALGKSEAVARYSLDSLELLVSGAAPLDEALALAVAKRLGCEVRQAYGMSEMSPVSHVAPIGVEVEPSSVGWTVPNMSCRLLDPATGEVIPIPEVGASRPGELCCAGPNIMAGYLGRPDATSETIDADGYLHTGDIATVSADGAVTIVDRIKELIKYKGYQVAPAELEGILLTHPDVADAAVVGVVDASTGEELPKAFVVCAEGRLLTAEDVITFVADRVAPYKKVRLVEFIDRVPKSPSGKILRRQLRVVEGV
jgi:4-coumarate--CoA ligase